MTLTPKYDPSINLGHILTILALTGSVFLAYTGVQVRLEEHEGRITTIERDIGRDAAVQQQILQTLTTIREDIAALKADSRNRRQP